MPPPNNFIIAETENAYAGDLIDRLRRIVDQADPRCAREGCGRSYYAHSVNGRLCPSGRVRPEWTGECYLIDDKEKYD